MEKEQHQWIVHEEVEDAALERRKFLPQSKNNLVTGVVVSSSSSPAGNGGMHNNGVCSVTTDPDRSLVQKEDEVAKMGIVGENGFHLNDDKVDYPAVGFGLVAEFVGAGATFSAAVTQNKKSVYFDKQQDNEVNGLNGVQNGDDARSICPTNQGEREFDVRVENSVIENSLCNEVNNQCIKTVDEKVTSSSELSSLHNSSAIQATAVTDFDDGSCTKEGPNLIKEIDQQLKELDVEAVLAKQETHDLFCPNCNSCITQRVILKKRKRNIHNLDNKAKRDKLDTIVSSKLVDNPPHEGNQGDRANALSNISLEIPADNYDHEREPEVFRCLSCFSFFVPTGFYLFRNFGGAREHETSQNPSSIPASNLQNPSNLPGSNTNWLFSLFTSTKGEKADNVEDMSSMSFSDEVLFKLENVKLATAATTEILVNDGEPAKKAILNPCEGEPQFRVPTTLESPILENSQKDVDKTPEIVQSSYSSLKQGAQSPVQSFGDTVLPSGVASNKQSSRIDAIIPKKHDFALTEKVQKDAAEEINPSVRKENKGTDVIVFVEGEAFESTTSQAADNAPFQGTIMTESRTQVYIGEKPRAEIGEPQEREILKSIVYGGLIESITSLGIVSSAAGSGAAPLNIIALGLANLVGGLFILGHNLIELRNDHSRGDQHQMDIKDRYQELLGRRTDYLLHAAVAILSFLIFGSVPLVIYGLLISKNYYAEVKLATVAATSVVCIIMLAIGKVYTKRPPKSYIKTVVYYVTLALAASGVSYIGGNLIKDLLEKSSYLESGSAIVIPMSDTSYEAWVLQN